METRTQSRSSTDTQGPSLARMGAIRFLAGEDAPSPPPPTRHETQARDQGAPCTLSSEERRAPQPQRALWVRTATAASSVLVLGLAAGMPRPSHAQPMSGRPIVVEIEGFRNELGEVMAGLYASSTEWLHEPVGHCHAPIHAGRARCVFTVLGSARLAIAGMHDENGNRDMDRDFFGFPQEGYFFSNDVRGALGPPSFEAAVFSVPQVRPLIAHVRYGI